MYGDRIRKLRKEKGLTQENLATLLGFKSGSAIGMIEREERELNIDTLNKLSELFGVTVDFILGKSDVKVSEVSQFEEELPEILDKIKKLNKPQRDKLLEMINQFQNEFGKL